MAVVPEVQRRCNATPQNPNAGAHRSTPGHRGGDDAQVRTHDCAVNSTAKGHHSLVHETERVGVWRVGSCEMHAEGRDPTPTCTPPRRITISRSSIEFASWR
jgi:hypothetical protein